MKRVAILISHAHQEPFISILEGFERPSKFQFEGFSFDLFYFEGRRVGRIENWLRVKVERIRYSIFWPILRLYDSVFLWLAALKLPEAKEGTDESGRRFLKINTPDDQRHIALKVYSALVFCENAKYDFVIRTTSNSILNLNNLVTFLRSEFSERIVYAGREVKSHNRPPFISGSFLILNRFAVENLLKLRKFHNYGVLDDVAIGRILEKVSEVVTKQYCQSLDFPSVSHVSDYPYNILPESFHYRCKSIAIQRNDLKIMLELKKHLSKQEIDYV